MLLYLPRFDFVSPCFSLHITYLSSENKHGNGLKNEKQSAQKPIAVKETCRWLYIDNWGAYLKKPGEPIENTIEHNKGSQDTTSTRISCFFSRIEGHYFEFIVVYYTKGAARHISTRLSHDTTALVQPRSQGPLYLEVGLGSKGKGTKRNDTARNRLTEIDTIEG